MDPSKLTKLRGLTATPPAAAVAARDRLRRRKPRERRIRWPGGEAELVVRLLTLAERRQALDAARQAAKGDADALAVERWAAVLAIALRDAATGEPLFATPAEFASSVFEDEQTALAAEYAELRRESDPNLVASDVADAITAAVDARSPDELLELAGQLPREHLLALLRAVVGAFVHVPPDGATLSEEELPDVA